MVKRVLLVENEKQIARFIDLELQKKGIKLMWSRMEKRVWPWLLRPNMIWSCLITICQICLVKHSQRKSVGFAQLLFWLFWIAAKKIAEHKESIQRFAVSYMVKPFIISDLVDKITAIFRGRDYIDQHCSQMKIPTSYRNLRIDVEHHTVYRGKDMISLTRREYDLLATLMGSKGVVTRDQLLESVWKYESTGETNIVDVYIRYLRGKIDLPGQKSYIKTVRGIGYAMQDTLE